MAKKIEIRLQTVSCKRCKYEWIPRRVEIRVCPRCKSPYWDQDKRTVKVNK